jgi:hypothetical protein
LSFAFHPQFHPKSQFHSAPSPFHLAVLSYATLRATRRRYRAPSESQSQLQLSSDSSLHLSSLHYFPFSIHPYPRMQIQFRLQLRPRTYPSPPIVPDAQNHSRNLLASNSENPWPRPRTPSINASKSECSSHSRPRSHNHESRSQTHSQQQLYMLRPSLSFPSLLVLFCSVLSPDRSCPACLACMHCISFISCAVRFRIQRPHPSCLFNIPPQFPIPNSLPFFPSHRNFVHYPTRRRYRAPIPSQSIVLECVRLSSKLFYHTPSSS